MDHLIILMEDLHLTVHHPGKALHPTSIHREEQHLVVRGQVPVGSLQEVHSQSTPLHHN